MQCTANSTMNIISRRMTIDPALVELANSLVWWAGSTAVGAVSFLECFCACDCGVCVCVCVCVCVWRLSVFYYLLNQ